MKQRLQEKGFVIGTMLSEFYSPNAAAIFRAGGFDFFIIDCEHGGYDFGQVAAMVSAARHSGITAIVRVPQIDKEGMLKYLEMGAGGLLVPMVSTVEEARRVVDLTRYAPLGSRGISTRRAHNDYDGHDMKGYMARANETVTILVQIETGEGVANAEAIAATPGIDGLVIGPSDLSSSLGEFGNFETDAFKAAVDTVIAAGRAHGRPVGFVHSNPKVLRAMRDKGIDILSWNSEIGMIISQSRDAIKALDSN